ncbi:MAG: hypothetical protein R3F43_20660 [bacterium]
MAGQAFAAPACSCSRRGRRWSLVCGGGPLRPPGRRAAGWPALPGLELRPSRRLRLEAAKKAWKDGQFGAVIDDDERAPLPDEAPHLVLDVHADRGQVLLYQQGEILGEMTWVRVDADTVRVDHTGVREAARGGGWARRLVLRGVEWARPTTSASSPSAATRGAC